MPAHHGAVEYESACGKDYPVSRADELRAGVTRFEPGNACAHCVRQSGGEIVDALGKPGKRPVQAGGPSGHLRQRSTGFRLICPLLNPLGIFSG